MGGTILILALMATGPPCASIPVEPGPRLETSLFDPGLRSGFLRLFAGADYGFARFERAAWIVRAREGPAQFLPWPFTGASGRAAWPGRVPDAAIAVVHTHPNVADPRPSTGDIRLARRLGVPVLALSRGALWTAWPDGRTSEIRGTGPLGWADGERPLDHEGNLADGR
jgi:hypothetical protein